MTEYFLRTWTTYDSIRDPLSPEREQTLSKARDRFPKLSILGG